MFRQRSILPNIKGYCTPAKTYMVLAVISIAFSIAENFGMQTTFSLGSMKTYVGNTYLVLLFEVVYLLVWGWFIDWLCRKRAKNIAWFLVLFPYVLGIMAFFGYYKMNNAN